MQQQVEKNYKDLAFISALLTGIALLTMGFAFLPLQEEVGGAGIIFIAMGAVNILIALIGKLIVKRVEAKKGNEP